MDFVKQDIHICTRDCYRCSELTIDEDFNIPDSKGDVQKIIARQGRIVLDDMACEEGRVRLRGTLHFQMIYLIEEQEVEFFDGTVPFEDTVNLECVGKQSKPEVRSNLEDLSVEMINSRKLSVRALIKDCVRIYGGRDENVISELVMQKSSNGENAGSVETLTEELLVTERPVYIQDAFHIKEELEIPQSKPNIEQILWWDVSLRNMDFRCITDGIRITGTVEIFAIYKGAEDRLPMQCVYVARNISEELRCTDAREDMISDIKCNLGRGSVSIRPDDDGEDRVIAIDFIANVVAGMYREKKIKVLKDAYSTQANLSLDAEPADIENIITHNRAKMSVTQRRRVDATGSEGLMQICHIFGDAVIDDYWHDENLYISGNVKACVLYVASGREPISAMCTLIPFEYQVELEKTASEDIQIVPSINELSANMINGEELDIKAEVNLDILAFSRHSVELVRNVSVEPLDMEKKAASPGMVGYVVGKGDTLWSIARRYYATTDSIRRINELSDDDIKEGDRLLIMKS
jgi:LysM repeat protein